MALQRPFDLNGVHYPEAYTRITSINVDKVNTYVYACTYATIAARLANDFPIFAEQHSAMTEDLSGPIYPSCYAFLKTLPGFEQAIDVNPNESVVPEDGMGIVVDPEVLS